MSFLDHIEELRWHIIRSLIAVGVFTCVAFLAKGLIFDELIFGPMHENFLTYVLSCKLGEIFSFLASLCMHAPAFEIKNFEMASQFLVHIKVSAILGVIIAFPYIVWELWRFIKPALYENERKFARGIVFYASLLFFMGIAFGYYILTPFSINFLSGYTVSNSVENLIGLSSYIGMLSSIVMATGLIFELPMAVYLLSKIGLLTPDFMRTYRRHAVVVLLLLSAIVTPPDVVSQVLVFMPIYFLYEVGILISARVEKQRIKELGY
ncbi:MAG: twin-arginine translocase subunit TatC [Chitinophagales bacterium]|nr:twin-arginine translocase subunit TatC [Chitinophagales bacterium]